MTVAKRPAAPAKVTAPPKKAPATIKVKNISDRTINLAKGKLEPGRVGMVPFSEFSRLHRMLEIA